MAVGVHHDVGRLQIAVDDAGFVRGGKARRHLLGEDECAIDGQPAIGPQDRGEVRSLHVRHRDVSDAADLSEIVNADDVFVSDLSGEHELALEAPLEIAGRFGVLERLRTDHLDGDGPLERLVPGLVDRAHATAAQEPNDVIAGAEVLADDERAAAPRGGLASGQRACQGAGEQRGWRRSRCQNVA